MPGARSAGFQVEGLQPLIQALGVLPQHWRIAEIVFVKAAAAAVIVRAKDLANQYASTNGVLHHATKELRSGGVGSVLFGGKPWDFGAEFGSKRYKQFLPWRGNDDGAGYFLWPTVRLFRD